MNDAIQRAVHALDDETGRGGRSKLAAAVGVSHPAVSNWIARGRIPAEKALAVSRATGVPLHELRPDIYPAPADQPA